MTNIETISQTRAALTTVVARFRDEGISASPVVFGDHRKPEAVLLSFQTYQILLDIAEDVILTEHVRDRDSRDTGARTTLADLAATLDIDLNTPSVRKSDTTRRLARILAARKATRD